MQGNMTAFNLGEAQKRHIVVGCGLHRIVTPYLRQFVEPTMQKAYNTLKSKNHVHTQTFQNHIKEYNGFKLNYRSINNNNSHKGKAAEKKYDYRVSNPVDFAKLFLQPFMAHMTGFDDSCDMSALLGLLCNVGDFSQDVRDAASQVRKEVRNKWAHCDFSDWTQGHFLRCFQLMEKLVKSLKLPSPDEQKCVQDLQDWKQRGVQLIWGQVIDKDLLRVVQQDVAAMQSNLVKYKESNDGEVERLVEQLKNIEEVLAKTLEGQVTLRRDVNTIGESVTEIKDRVTTLEDDHGQVAEQVCSLEHREANVEQEVGAVAEKVENIDRSLTDFQQRQVSVHSTVAAEQEVQDKRLQTLEKGQVKLQQRVDRVESWQQEVSENSEARRQEVCYSEDAFETLKHLLTEVRVEDNSLTDTYNRLARHVAESGLTFRAEVPKDGNCMFHAVSDQLFRTKAQRINHEQLRNQAVDFLRGHPYNSNGDHLRAFVPDENWERYLSAMSRDGTWGDHIVLQAMADMFGHDISIVSSVEAENYVTILTPTPGNVASEEPPLLLGHYAENHYASLDQLSKTKATAKRPLHPHHYHHWLAAAQDCVIIEGQIEILCIEKHELE